MRVANGVNTLLVFQVEPAHSCRVGVKHKRCKDEVADSIMELAEAVSRLHETPLRVLVTGFECDPGTRPARVRFGFGVGMPQKKERNRMLELTITNEQKIRVTLSPKTDTGKPAPLDGVPTWEIVTGNATLAVAADGLSADLISADDPGDSQVLVKADANIGEGVEEISDVISLRVVGATAKNLGLSAGQPEPKA